jgi:geranylgeranyl pyrophosphate synthase
VRQVLQEVGSVTYTSTLAERFVDQALARLRVVPASAPRDLLEAWAHSMTARAT